MNNLFHPLSFQGGGGGGRGKRKSAAHSAAMVDTDMPMLSAEDKEKPYACNSKCLKNSPFCFWHLYTFSLDNFLTINRDIQ